MAGNTVKFVDQITASPTTRLNLNDETTWATTNFDAPPPRLRRSVAVNALRDGGVVGSSNYELRVLTIHLELITASQDTNATQLQNLVRELDRETNFIMYQPVGATAPVFFKTYRSDASQIMDVLAASAFRTITIEVLAEPFAYGLKVTGSGTFNANPATGLHVDITSVQGDVAAPLEVSLDGQGSASLALAQAYGLLSIRRRGTPGNVTHLVQAEACTQGLDTTTQVNSASYSGSGNNYSRCTFATSPATANTRLTFTMPTGGGTSTDLVGTYKVIVRFAKTVAADVIGTSLRITAGTTYFPMADLYLKNSTNIQQLCMGTVTFPFNGGMTVDPSGAPVVSNAVTCEFRAWRTSGTGSLDIDYILFIPADERTAWIYWPTGTSVNPNRYLHLLEGTQPWVTLAANDQIAGFFPSPLIDGGLPLVKPGATNRLYYVIDANRAAANVASPAHSISGSVALAWAYHPRYLYVRPATT